MEKAASLEVFLICSFKSIRKRNTPLTGSLVKFKRFGKSRVPGISSPYNVFAVFSTPYWDHVSTDPTTLKQVPLRMQFKQPDHPDSMTFIIRGTKTENNNYFYELKIETTRRILIWKEVFCDKPWDIGGLRDYMGLLFPTNSRSNILGLHNIDRIETDFKISMDSSRMWVEDSRGVVTSVLQFEDEFYETHPCCLWMRTPQLTGAQLLLPYLTVWDSHEAKSPWAPLEIPEERDLFLWFKYKSPRLLLSGAMNCLADCVTALMKFVNVDVPFIVNHKDFDNIEEDANTAHVRTQIEAVATIHLLFVTPLRDHWISVCTQHFEERAHAIDAANDEPDEDLQAKVDDFREFLTLEWGVVESIANLDIGREVTNESLWESLHDLLYDAPEPMLLDKNIRNKFGYQSDQQAATLYDGLDLLDFGKILQQNCADYLDPAVTSQGLFWRHSHPNTFKKFFLRAVEEFVRLNHSTSYLCEFNRLDDNLIPCRKGEIYIRSSPYGDLGFSSSALRFGNNQKVWCPTQNHEPPENMKAIGWRVAESSKMTVFHRRFNNKQSWILAVDLEQSQARGSIHYSLEDGNAFRQLKIVSEKGQPTKIWKLCNSRFGLIEKLWFDLDNDHLFDTEANDGDTETKTHGRQPWKGQKPVKLKSEQIYLADILSSSQDEGIRQEKQHRGSQSRQLSMKKLLKFKFGQDTIKDDEENNDLSQESSYSDEDSEEMIPKDAQTCETGKEGIRLRNNIILECLEVAFGRIFVMGCKVLPQRDELPDTDFRNVKGEVFLLSVSSNTAAKERDSPFWFPHLNQLDTWRFSMPETVWRKSAVHVHSQNKEYKKRDENWVEHLNLSAIKKYRTSCLLAVIRNTEFTVVSYNQHRRTYQQISPVSSIFPDRGGRFENFHYFWDANKLTVTVLNIPSNSHKKGVPDRSGSKQPVFNWQRYKLKI